MRMWRGVVVILLLLAATAASAERLIGLDPAGAPVPGVATRWQFQDDTGLLLTIKPGWGESARQAVCSALEDEKVSVFLLDSDTLLIEGAEPALLLAKLAGLELAAPEPAPAPAGDDALTRMLVADAGLTAPDGSSSLRVSGDVTEQEALVRQFVARVLAVDQSRGFPYARVKVRIETAPVSPLKGISMNPGDILTLVPFFSEGSSPATPDLSPGLDLRDAATRVNLGVWFLIPGDRVSVLPGSRGSAQTVNAHRIQREP